MRKLFLVPLPAPPAPAGAYAAAPAGAPVAAVNGGRAELGTFGFDEAGMDRSVAPGDNFYGFANGNWARTTAIPPDKSSYGMFTRLDDISRARTREILDEASRNPTSKIGNAYASYLDTGLVERKGLAPFEPWLNRIRALSSKDGYAGLVAEASRNGIGGP